MSSRDPSRRTTQRREHCSPKIRFARSSARAKFGTAHAPNIGARVGAARILHGTASSVRDAEGVAMHRHGTRDGAGGTGARCLVLRKTQPCSADIASHEEWRIGFRWEALALGRLSVRGVCCGAAIVCGRRDDKPGDSALRQHACCSRPPSGGRESSPKPGPIAASASSAVARVVPQRPPAAPPSTAVLYCRRVEPPS